QRVSGGPRFWLLAATVALTGNCIPFFLISWAQMQLESGLAGILAATSPLWVLLLSHFALHDERLEGRQVGAFVLAFVGVVVLLGFESLAGLGGALPRLLAQLAILAAALCYAVTTV